MKEIPSFWWTECKYKKEKNSTNFENGLWIETLVVSQSSEMSASHSEKMIFFFSTGV
jgi:hypothetical protein